MIRFALIVCLLSLLIVSRRLDAADVDYQRQVQPILAEHCTHCHGVDESARQGGLRLDVQSSAFQGGDSGDAAIVPGKPELSQLVHRIHSNDSDELMPPSVDKKPLDEAEMKILEQWIREGAKYESHWAFVAPVRPATEINASINSSSNPIDTIIDFKHREQGWSSFPRANDAVLCRRVYLDIIGLPPTPEQFSEYMRIGHNATVDLLLKDDRYGEKWARHWLDLARYSDTNGYEKDLRREQWVWRDWVIRAIQTDMPYDQFVILQIAGDLLPNADQDSMIATGFLRNSMLNEEGAIVPEQFRMVEQFDRIDCIGKSILGVSVQCAQCHTHKFDPITHDEYYGMFAFLNDTYESKSWVYRPEHLAKIESIQSSVARIENQIKSDNSNWQESIAMFQKQVIGSQPDWKPIYFSQLESISGLNHPTHEEDQSILMLGHTSIDVFMVGEVEITGATGARIEALAHDDLPFGGPGRNAVGSFAIGEWEIFTKQPKSDVWDKQKLFNATTDFSNVEKKIDDKKMQGPVSMMFDGSDDTAWTSDRGNGRRNQASVAVVQFESPVDLPIGSQIKMVLRMPGQYGAEMIGCCRFSLTNATNPTATTITVDESPFFIDHESVLAMLTPMADRTEKQQSMIFSSWRKMKKEFQDLNQEIDRLYNEYPEGYSSVLHLAKRSNNKKRKTYQLDRGAWDKQTVEVQPHTPEAFHSISTVNSTNQAELLTGSGSVSRLDFARWLVAPQSPLAARVAVNRIWQNLFGVGIVETAEDMGVRVPVPEYRELLDWLAVDFMENRWSQQHTIRQIVTSQAYQRQSSSSKQDYLEDPKNSRLTRGPRFRLDAEIIRDVALSLSGLIHHEIGGPPVIPPVPQNVLDYNYVYPDYWTATQGPQRYRRSIYSFRKRSMPDPGLSSLDAPNGDVSCARRVRSNTPLAALTGLNETIFAEAARAFALRILKEGGNDDRQRIHYAFQLCTLRYPDDSELAALDKVINSQRERIAVGWLNAREIATGDPSKLPSLPNGATPQDAAVWTIVARVLLNLDETITKN